MTHVELHSFQTIWKEYYLHETHHLQQGLQTLDIDFHHVGSTAISGCIAKPVIDILGVVNDHEDLIPYNDLFKILKYESYGEYGIKDRRYFSKYEQPLPVHLHVFEKGHPEIERMLRFRDYLIHNPIYIEEYNQLKKDLAAKYDRLHYASMKDPFIKKISFLAAQETHTIFYPVPLEKIKEWTQEKIIHAMIENWHLQLTYFSKYLPLFEPIFEKNATVVRANIQDDTYNFVAAAHFDEATARDEIRKCSSYFEPASLPFSWWISPMDSSHHLENILEEEGFTKTTINIGMHLSLKEPLSCSFPDKLKIERLLHKKDLKDFSDIIVQIGMHPSIYEKIYSQIPEILYAEGAPYEFYVGKIDDLPIVTGILLFHAHVAGIYYISTHPTYRKKGYATAMMQHLLNRAYDKGYEIAVLQASPEGRFVYEKMGFTECCSFKEYKKN